MAATFMQAMVETYGTIANAPTLWGEQVADTQNDYPRAELNHMGEVPDYAVDGVPSNIEANAQFVLHDTSLAGVETLATSIMDTFTPTSLTITGKINRLWRTGYTLAMQADRTTEQMPVFFATIEYHCSIM